MKNALQDVRFARRTLGKKKGLVAGAVTIGIRAALGAASKDLLRSALWSRLLLTPRGLAIGAARALTITRAISTILYGIGPHDPAAIFLVGAVVFLTSALACLVPAYRAMRVDPTVALRYE